MMYRILAIVAAMLIASAGTLAAQKEQDTVRFRVYGNCEMCQERIEEALLARDGVIKASWSPDTKVAFVIFAPKKVSYLQLHETVTKVGHDTDLLSADDDVYADLHECCLYDRPTKTTVYKLEDVSVERQRATMLADYTSPMNTTIMDKRELFKAACCNLSESFETNPAVDVSYSDAVTGAKQIEMLGLAGIYSQITRESMPSVRGINGIFGISQVPGTWIESIQVNKGAGSVINGYESITGQINVEIIKPHSEMHTLYNGYVNDGGRFEGNLVHSLTLNEQWGTTLLLFAKYIPILNDRTLNGFMDMPAGTEFSAMNRWQYTNGNDVEGQFGVSVLHSDTRGGQVDFNPSEDRFSSNFFGVSLVENRYEAWGKLGYSDPTYRSRTIGLQVSAMSHRRDAFFGRRDYMGEQQTLYANLIGQLPLDEDENHLLKGGVSYLLDHYHEQYMDDHYMRTEAVPGIFTEYTFKSGNTFSAVAGLRADAHNMFGTFVTPRLHLRYAPVESTVLRASGGRGQRTANIFAENMAAFVSSRQVRIIPTEDNDAFGLLPEVAWNFGGSITQYFNVGGREATFSVEAYRTEFTNQVIADLDFSARELVFYNLTGKSYSTSVQAELSFDAMENFPLRFAYRFVDAQTDYLSGRLERPFLARHRTFMNAEYRFVETGWTFDVTPQWFSRKRLPSTADNPEEYRLNDYSDAFLLVNAQITKTLGKKWEVYLGVENATNFKQPNPVLSPNDPFGEHFDASFIWAPIMGRMFYAGFRFTP